jgi:SAM-dependent methyltransferase
MSAYDALAEYYDVVNEDPVELVELLATLLASCHPSATTILELGCGTGAILEGLGPRFTRTGVDLSGAMLARARQRCPDVNFLHGDITTISLARRFDAVICVLDTLNHVTTPKGWTAVFEVAKAHLAPGGVVLVDLATPAGVDELVGLSPWSLGLASGEMRQCVVRHGNGLVRFTTEVLDANGNVVLHGQIDEWVPTIAEIRQLAAAHFAEDVAIDDEGAALTDASLRALFVWRAR